MKNVVKLCLILACLSVPGLAQKIEVCRKALSSLVDMDILEGELNKRKFGPVMPLAKAAIAQSHHVFIRTTDADGQETYFHFQSANRRNILGHKAELSYQPVDPDDCEMVWEGDDTALFGDHLARIVSHFEEQAQHTRYHILNQNGSKNCQTVVEEALQNIFQVSSPMLQNTNQLVKQVEATLRNCCIQ